MDKKPLLNTHAERMERAQEKQTMLLEFLQSERYTSARVASALLEISEPAARLTLNKMTKNDLLNRDNIDVMGKRFAAIWGLSQEGVYESYGNELDTDSRLTPFKPGRISGTNLIHDLECQLAHVYFIYRAGHQNWISGKTLHADTLRKKHWQHIPDGIFDLLNEDREISQTMAVEVERIRKAPNRYKNIIYTHLSNIHQGRYTRVMYLLPEQKKADSLKRLFERLFLKYQIKDEDQEKFGFKSFETVVFDRLFPEKSVESRGQQAETSIKKTFSLYPSDIEQLAQCFSHLSGANWSDKLRVAISALTDMADEDIERLYREIKG